MQSNGSRTASNRTRIVLVINAKKTLRLNLAGGLAGLGRVIGQRSKVKNFDPISTAGRNIPEVDVAGWPVCEIFRTDWYPVFRICSCGS